MRTLRDDLKWALAVLAGFALGALVFGAEASLILGAVAGTVLVVAFRVSWRRWSGR
jgi:hypothetical protein